MSIGFLLFLHKTITWPPSPHCLIFILDRSASCVFRVCSVCIYTVYLINGNLQWGVSACRALWSCLCIYSFEEGEKYAQTLSENHVLNHIRYSDLNLNSNFNLLYLRLPLVFGDSMGMKHCHLTARLWCFCEVLDSHHSADLWISLHLRYPKHLGWQLGWQMVIFCFHAGAVWEETLWYC